MRTYEFSDGTSYKARDCIDGILIDPQVPARYWSTPIERWINTKWDGLLFIRTREDGGYEVWALDGGAWDRPTWWGQADTIAAAVEIAKNGPSWRRAQA